LVSFVRCTNIARRNTKRKERKVAITTLSGLKNLANRKKCVLLSLLLIYELKSVVQKCR
jgi:hypothetical protein